MCQSITVVSTGNVLILCNFLCIVCIVTAKTLPFEVLATVRELVAAAAPAPPAHQSHEPLPQLLEAYLYVYLTLLVFV